MEAGKIIELTGKYHKFSSEIPWALQQPKKNPPTTSKKVLPSSFCACLSSSASSTPTSYQESATRCYIWNIKDQFAKTLQYFPIFSMHFQKILFAKVQNGPCKRVKFGATPCSSNVCAHYGYYGHG
jgi:hypothetical protein